MARLKQPPYAKEIIQRRRKGRHPWVVVVTFNDAWVKPEFRNQIHIPLLDYESHMYDFSCLAGLAVKVCVSSYYHHNFLVFRLVSELMKVAAPVRAQWYKPRAWQRLLGGRDFVHARKWGLPKPEPDFLELYNEWDRDFLINPDIDKQPVFVTCSLQSEWYEFEGQEHGVPIPEDLRKVYSEEFARDYEYRCLQLMHEYLEEGLERKKQREARKNG